MSKKDFELIARVLRERGGYFTSRDGQDAYSIIVQDFANELAATNPRFDRERFIAACMGEDSTDSAGRKVRYSAR